MTWPLFPWLLLELQSNCNRDCSFCCRTYDRSGARKNADGSRVLKSMPTEHAERILHESHALGFRGPVYFYLFSEPFLDPRLIEMAKLARKLGMLPRVNTNGDQLRKNAKLRSEATSVFDAITIGLYEADTPVKHAAAVTEWRKLMGDRIGFSSLDIMGPRPGNQMGAAPRIEETCRRLSQRLIVTYDGNSAICCYDLRTEFGLPNAFEHSVKDVWWSDRRLEVAAALRIPGGRKAFPMCRQCCMPAAEAPPSGGWGKARSLVPK